MLENFLEEAERKEKGEFISQEDPNLDEEKTPTDAREDILEVKKEDHEDSSVPTTDEKEDTPEIKEEPVSRADERVRSDDLDISEDNTPQRTDGVQKTTPESSYEAPADSVSYSDKEEPVLETSRNNSEENTKEGVAEEVSREEPAMSDEKDTSFEEQTQKEEASKKEEEDLYSVRNFTI